MPSVELPVVGFEVAIPLVAALGLAVGCLAGFFGVGGGFLMTPMLNVLFGIPYPLAIMSAAGCWRHRRLGNVDFKLGLLAVIGMIPGVEAGAQVVEMLQRAGTVTVGGVEMPVTKLVMSAVYSVLLAWVGLKMWRESRSALRAQAGSLADGSEHRDEAISRFGRRLHRIRLMPMVSLTCSGIEAVSAWVVIGVGLCTGFLSGLLGVGGGFVFLPAMIYLLGVPTAVAVGTSLFSIFIASGYGAFTHSLKGNVDLLLVIMLLVPSAIGTQIGAGLTKRAGGPRTRQCFSLVAAFAMVMVMGKLIHFLVTGGPAGH